MDWERVITGNTEALKRILLSLVAMAGGLVTSPSEGGGRAAGAGGGDLRATAPTLPRRLRNAILRILRPMESATRRLIVVAARGIVVKLPPLKAPKPKPKPQYPDTVVITRRRGVMCKMVWRPGSRFPEIIKLPPKPPVTQIAFPLIDTLRRPWLKRRRTCPPHRAPRVLNFDSPPRRLPPPPGPNDLLDATRIGLRLQALASVLADLPAQAKRLARWMALRARARASGRLCRTSPLKSGRAPGALRKPRDEIHHVLKDLQYFAYVALKPDTS